jgi:predicted membrane protein
MTADKFWLGWLKITMGMVVIAGFILALFSDYVFSDFLNMKINRIFFSGSSPTVQVEILKKWMLGVCGAVMIGWGLSMLYVVNNSFKRREQWAWRCIFYPVLAWYLIDSGISAYFGVGFNVMINSILFLQIVAPLLFLRSQFFPQFRMQT